MVTLPCTHPPDRANWVSDHLCLGMWYAFSGLGTDPTESAYRDLQMEEYGVLRFDDLYKSNCSNLGTKIGLQVMLTKCRIDHSPMSSCS